MPAQLKNGVQGAPGGKRSGAGRKPDWFKKWVGTLVKNPKNRKRLEKILADEQDAETLVTSEGVEVPVRCSADTYLRAYQFAASYDQGKPHQTLEHTGEGGSRLVFIHPESK